MHMAYQSCCAAISMNLLFEKKDFILIDFSSSKIEMTVFANYLIISQGIIKLGTWEIFSLLKNHFRRKHKIEISDTEIEDLLITLKQNQINDEVKI